jgi:GNAT superfamily N-acetyltransferase
MPVIVRNATLADAEAVTHVMVESRKALVPFAPMAHTPDEVCAWIGRSLIPTGAVWVALADQKIVAMMVISDDNTQRWINQLYVLPGFESRGIGSQLLHCAHRQLRPPIRLWTFAANAGARRFYERHGYTALRFTDGAGNEERCADVLYEFSPD